uniref:uncharacterized protein LOC118518013 isoform X9 n=1 Tax=Halichoerus grypus TaxID=9711 RepID=UPI001658C964|nr:uncharacterized protein LOC118518013 isoform X9 [Halichoerus grypus]
MTWVSELRFLVCTGKITALYEVVVRLPGGDVGFDKGKPVLGSSCCTREPWGAPDHTSRTPQKSLRICQGGHLHPEHCDHPTSSNLIFIKDKNFHLFCSPLYSQCLGQRRREMRKRNRDFISLHSWLVSTDEGGSRNPPSLGNRSSWQSCFGSFIRAPNHSSEEIGE